VIELRKKSFVMTMKIFFLFFNLVEILMLEETIVLYKCINDINIYIIGCLNENEILLYDVMNAFTNSLSSITKYG
jgi:hypothetical protein